MKVLKLNSWQFQYSTSYKFLLEDEEWFVLTFNDSLNVCSINSSLGTNVSFNYEEESLELFFQNNTVKEIVKKIKIKNEQLEKNILPKIKSYFSVEKEKIQYGSSDLNDKEKKVLSFISSCFGIYHVFCSDTVQFNSIPDLHTGDSLIDDLVDEFIYREITSIFKMDIPRSMLKKSIGMVIPYLMNRIREVKKKTGNSNYSGTGNMFLNIKGIVLDNDKESGFFRVSYPFFMKSHYDYKDNYMKFHVDGIKASEDKSFVSDHKENYKKVYGNNPNTIIFTNGREIKCKNFLETTSVIRYIASFWNFDNDNSEYYHRQDKEKLN